MRPESRYINDLAHAFLSPESVPPVASSQLDESLILEILSRRRVTASLGPLAKEQTLEQSSELHSASSGGSLNTRRSSRDSEASSASNSSSASVNSRSSSSLPSVSSAARASTAA